MSTFEVGDRIICDNPADCNERWRGATGTVVLVESGGVFGIRLDKPNGFHSCSGCCEVDNGKCFGSEEMSKIDVLESVTGDPRVEGEL